MVERAWAENMGQFLYHLDPDTNKITKLEEKLRLEIINSAPSSLIKLALITTCCLNIHSSIYIYIYIHNHGHTHSNLVIGPVSGLVSGAILL